MSAEAFGRALTAGVVTAAVAWGAFAVGQASAPAEEVNGLPSIPRCVNDDWNDGSQDRCWTESPDGVIVIDASDRVVSITAP